MLHKLKIHIKKIVIIIFGEKFLKQIRNRPNNKPQRYLNGFEIHLVEQCNLNCWGCNHYSPLAEEEYLQIDSFERDIKRMSELTNHKVNYLHLMGGEPMLHPAITEFFRVSRKYFPNSRINLFTNGTLLLKQDAYFWQKMRKYNIVILASKYPIVNWAKIEKIVYENKVFMEYTEYQKVKVTWYCPLDLNGTQDIYKSFMHCGGANKCIFLYNGRLFTCSMAPNFRHFNKFFGKDIRLTEKDSIDIYKAKNIKQILKNLAKPISACRYCNVFGFYTVPWKRSRKEITEWA
jgi:hypothetical protein